MDIKFPSDTLHMKESRSCLLRLALFYSVELSDDGF